LRGTKQSNFVSLNILIVDSVNKRKGKFKETLCSIRNIHSKKWQQRHIGFKLPFIVEIIAVPLKSKIVL